MSSNKSKRISKDNRRSGSTSGSTDTEEFKSLIELKPINDKRDNDARIISNTAFFEAIYGEWFTDGLKQHIINRNKYLNEQGGLIVVLCASHHAHFTREYRYKEYLKKQNIMNTRDRRSYVRNNKQLEKLLGTQTLKDNEIFCSFNSLLGLSSSDLGNFIPSLFLLNGSNTQQINMDNTAYRMTPENQLSNYKFIETAKLWDKIEPENKIEDFLHLNTRKYGISTIYGAGENVPNLSMAGDNQELIKGHTHWNKMKMFTYVIDWGSFDEAGFPNVYYVHNGPSYSTIGEYTLGEMLDGIRKFNVVHQKPIHIFASACQVIDADIQQTEITELKKMTVNGMLNIDIFSNIEPPESDSQNAVEGKNNFTRYEKENLSEMVAVVHDEWEDGESYMCKDDLKTNKLDIESLWETYKTTKENYTLHNNFENLKELSFSKNFEGPEYHNGVYIANIKDGKRR